MRSKRDGEHIPGTAQTITAAEQRARLGLDTTKPKAAKLPLTPNQARRAMSDDWRGDDLDPPDYEASVVSDPQAIAAALGLRQSDFDAPLGSMPEGQPIPQPAVRPKAEPTAPTEPTTPPAPKAGDVIREAAKQAAQIRQTARADAARSASRIKRAIKSGDRAERDRAEKDGRATVEFLRKLGL